MGYIMHLREKIGHEELLTAGTGVFPVRDGKVLLQRRADNGLWTMHGGAIEIGEVPEDAAKREFFEETGLRANALELIGVFSGPDTRYTYPNGDQVSNVDIVFVCREWQGELVCQPGEVEALAFFAPEALPSPLHEIDHSALKAWMQLREAREQK